MKIYPFNFSDPLPINCDWDIFYYQNILDTEVFQQLQQEFNQIDWHANQQNEISNNKSIESSWYLLDRDHVCYEYFSNPELVSYLNTLAGGGSENYELKINFKYDSPNHKLQGLHLDVGLAAFTFQIFLQEESYPDGGTVVYSKTYGDFEIPMLSNSGGFFKNSRESWHSVRQRGYHRKSILVRYKNKS